MCEEKEDDHTDDGEPKKAAVLYAMQVTRARVEGFVVGATLRNGRYGIREFEQKFVNSRGRFTLTDQDGASPTFAVARAEDASHLDADGRPSGGVRNGRPREPRWEVSALIAKPGVDSGSGAKTGVELETNESLMPDNSSLL